MQNNLLNELISSRVLAREAEKRHYLDETILYKVDAYKKQPEQAHVLGRQKPGQQ